MKKRFILIILVVIIFMMGIIGCNNREKNNNKNKIIVATSGTYYPFTFMDGDKLTGFEIDVWNEIAKRLNYEVQFKTASFSGIFGMLESGKADVIANQITITDERKNKYELSDPYVYSGAEIITRDDDNCIKSFEDLKGKKVGVDLGSNYEKIVKDKDTKDEVTVLTYQNTDAAFNELLLGRIDAVVIDKVSALVAIHEKNLKLKLSGKPIDSIENAYAFAKNEKNKNLVNEVNKTLNNMRDDGTLKNISEKWLYGDVTIPGAHNFTLNETNSKTNIFKFDFLYAVNLIPMLIGALKITISLSVISMIVALIIGVLLTIIRMYNIPILKQFAEVYISFFRGTPLLVQLFLLYFGIPQIIPSLQNMSAYMAALIGLALNTAAYIAEVFRASFNAIDKGQMEACLSLGMSKGQGIIRIVFPQAFRISIPSLGNIFVDTVKGSSLAFTLGVVDLLAKAQMAAATSYKFFESFVVVALMYWIIISFFNYLQKLLEKKLAVY